MAEELWENENMETMKCDMRPFKDTIELSDVLGRNVLTKDGRKIGNVQSVHIHPRDLTIEGIVIDPGSDAYQFIGASYIDSMTGEGTVLNIPQEKKSERSKKLTVPIKQTIYCQS